MPTVRLWTGREAAALRRALRLSIRAFADYLGVAVRTVSKWEKLGAAIRPYPNTQAILDTALEQAGSAAQARFQLLLADVPETEDGEDPGPGAGRRPAAAQDRGGVAPRLDYETWADDLDRIVVAVSRQHFTTAVMLIQRWTDRYSPHELDEGGLYLYARSLALLGDVYRDEGRLVGPLSAPHAYERARAMFVELDVARRVAQLDLSLAVVVEMTGKVRSAARIYERLAADERLCERDRVRARLWIGTALSKAGEHDYAAGVMMLAARELEGLGEVEDWSVAQQKLALACRGTGDLGRAQRFIDAARAAGGDDTPMQRVRLATAQAHVWVSDGATRDHGMALLDDMARLAVLNGLSHQLRSIQSIRTSVEAGGAGGSPP